MTQKTQKNLTNNTTKTNKEAKIMKDYTLGGTINATTWQEFRKVMKEAGINTGTKSYVQLVEEYNALITEKEVVSDNEDVVISVGDFSQDKYYPELQKETEVKEKAKVEEVEQVQDETKTKKTKPEVFDKLPIALINKLIGELDDRKSLFDSRGKIDTKQVYKAIYACVGDGRSLIPENTMKGYINALVRLGYLRFERSEDGYIKFFVTFKDVVKDKNDTVIGVQW